MKLAKFRRRRQSRSQTRNEAIIARKENGFEVADVWTICNRIYHPLDRARPLLRASRGAGPAAAGDQDKCALDIRWLHECFNQLPDYGGDEQHFIWSIFTSGDRDAARTRPRRHLAGIDRWDVGIP